MFSSIVKYISSFIKIFFTLLKKYMWSCIFLLLFNNYIFFMKYSKSCLLKWTLLDIFLISISFIKLFKHRFLNLPSSISVSSDFIILSSIFISGSNFFYNFFNLQFYTFFIFNQIFKAYFRLNQIFKAQLVFWREFIFQNWFFKASLYSK